MVNVELFTSNIFVEDLGTTNNSAEMIAHHTFAIANEIYANKINLFKDAK